MTEKTGDSMPAAPSSERPEPSPAVVGERASGEGSTPASAFGDPLEGEQGAENELSDPDPLKAAEHEIARIREQLLRTAADFDNFRKRTKRELQDAERRGAEETLRELLPVFDNLERAEKHAEGVTDLTALADGLRLVMRQFQDTLGKLGIERIEGTGAAFDPSVHEAIQHLETLEHPPGVVAATVQAGYKLGERLIRPALVVVAKVPSN